MSLTYTHACLDCGKEYESAEKWLGFCPRCNRLINEQNRTDVGRKARSYTADMHRKGANRHVVRILHDEKSKDMP